MENQVVQSDIDKEVSVNKREKVNDVKSEEKEQGLLDFSSMFKKNGFTKRAMPKLGAERKTQTQGANWLLQIPAKLEIATSDFEQRRFMSQQKWKMMVKTSLPQASLAAAVISSVNYLSKTNFPQSFIQIKLKEIKEKLANQSTRKQVILQCLNIIKDQYKTSWLEFHIHQLSREGKNQVFLNHVIDSLKNPRKAFIYICYGQTLCPIGFDNTPLVPLDAYKKLPQISLQQMEMWIICASPLKSQAPFLIKRWVDIQKEMTSRWPQFLDLEETKKGRQTLKKNFEQTNLKINQVSCWIELTCSQQ